MCNNRTNQMTKTQARQLFIYEDGKLYWKNPGMHRTLDKPVGTNAGRYFRVGMRVNGKVKCYQLHNIIYNYHFGKIKTGLEVHHIDANGFNNKLDNLTLVTHQENIRLAFV